MLRPRLFVLAAVLAWTACSNPAPPSILRPGLDGARLQGEDTAAQPHPLTDGTWRLEDLARADRAGFWRLRLAGGDEVAYAVGLDANEGRLERLDVEELTGLSPVYVAAREGDASSGDAGDSGELWRPLLLGVLLLLVGESMWARRLTREERP